MLFVCDVFPAIHARFAFCFALAFSVLLARPGLTRRSLLSSFACSLPRSGLRSPARARARPASRAHRSWERSARHPRRGPTPHQRRLPTLLSPHVRRSRSRHLTSLLQSKRHRPPLNIRRLPQPRAVQSPPRPSLPSPRSPHSTFMHRRLQERHPDLVQQVRSYLHPWHAVLL